MGKFKGEAPLSDSGRAHEQIGAGEPAGGKRLAKPLDDLVMTDDPLPHAPQALSE
jgi:hypothetical protein